MPEDQPFTERRAPVIIPAPTLADHARNPQNWGIAGIIIWLFINGYISAPSKQADANQARIDQQTTAIQINTQDIAVLKANFFALKEKVDAIAEDTQWTRRQLEREYHTDSGYHSGKKVANK